jgi:hypothetical protein
MSRDPRDQMTLRNDIETSELPAMAALPADPALPLLGRNPDFIFESPAVLANLRRHAKHPLPQFLGILNPLASPALKHNEPVGGPDPVVILNQDEVDPKLDDVPGLHFLRGLPFLGNEETPVLHNSVWTAGKKMTLRDERHVIERHRLSGAETTQAPSATRHNQKQKPEAPKDESESPNPLPHAQPLKKRAPSTRRAASTTSTKANRSACRDRTSTAAVFACSAEPRASEAVFVERLPSPC